MGKMSKKDDTEVKEQTKAEPTKADKPEPLKWAELPLISVLAKKPMQRAKELLEELELQTYCIDDNGRYVKREDRADEIKAELEELQKEAETRGLRWGKFAFAATEQQGRETLDKELLLMHEVPAATIAKCYKRGKGFTKREFKRTEL